MDGIYAKSLDETFVEDEEYELLRESIDEYDNFDQIALAQRCESHELIEFRRISGHIYQKNHRWKQSVELAKRDGLFKDAMEACAQSGDKELAENLLKYFIDTQNKECFAAALVSIPFPKSRHTVCRLSRVIT